MKKIVALLALTLVVSGAAFGLPELKLSFGGGALLPMVFGNGIKAGNYRSTNTAIGVGAFAFLDATFVEADFAFFGGGLTRKISNGSNSSSTSGSFAALDLSLLGKYPIPLGRMTVFPLLGIDYMIVVSAEYNDREVDKPNDLSSFAFDFGAGLDFPLGDRLYLRGELLYAIRLPSEAQQDAKNSSNDYILGNGPTIKVAVGYSL
jgi:hypothetical protein